MAQNRKSRNSSKHRNLVKINYSQLELEQLSSHLEKNQVIAHLVMGINSKWNNIYINITLYILTMYFILFICYI